MNFQFQPLESKSLQFVKHMTFPAFQSLLSEHSLGNGVMGMTVIKSEKPIGLILVNNGTESGTFDLLSIFIDKEFRLKGLGKKLLVKFLIYGKNSGIKKIKSVFEEGRPYSETIIKIFQDSSFSPLKNRGIMCRCLGSSLRKAPWLKKQMLPSSFKIFPWCEITQKQKTFIQKQYVSKKSFPEILSPFKDMDIIEHLNSLGLLYKNEIVGWQINHRIAKDTVRYTAMYVREDLQKFGLAIPLMIEAIRKQLYCGDFTLNKATFFVPTELTGMTKFVKNHMKPYLDQINNSVECEKIL